MNEMKSISISEFFEKNKQMLGFGNASKAFVTSVKEAVDNSLDACEEYGFLPEITVDLQTRKGETVVTITDNGPGISEENIPNVFGKLLYGSKFHRRKQSRGQQGIGISAVGMFSLITTGMPISVKSKKQDLSYCVCMDIKIDTKTNEAIVSNKVKTHSSIEHGTIVSFVIPTDSVPIQLYKYINYTAIANPHMQIMLCKNGTTLIDIPRTRHVLPKDPIEMKPHPFGITFSDLMAFFRTSGKTVLETMVLSLYGINSHTAASILKIAGLSDTAASDITPDACKKIISVIDQSSVPMPTFEKFSDKCSTYISDWGSLMSELGFSSRFSSSLFSVCGMSSFSRPAATIDSIVKKAYQFIKANTVVIPGPNANCISPIEENTIIAGMKSLYKADFFTACTRKPSTHNGNPFVVEVGIAWGGEIESFELVRIANKVPLLYGSSYCSLQTGVENVVWKPYSPNGEIDAKKGSLPSAKMAIVVHIASVWIPFINESKEAVSQEEQITKEVQLAVMQCARNLNSYFLSINKVDHEEGRRRLFMGYIPEVANALSGILEDVSGDEIKRDLISVMNELSERRVESIDWSKR